MDAVIESARHAQAAGAPYIVVHRSQKKNACDTK
jgi:hypothetical protein